MRNAVLYNFNSFFKCGFSSFIGCTRHIDPGDAMFGPELLSEVADFFEKLTPLYEYFNKFKV